VIRRKGLTLLELTIVSVIFSLLISLSFVAYTWYFEKARSTEAVLNIAAITRAEIMHKEVEGSFVPADNSKEINEILNAGITPKYYEYKVIGVTDDNFIVLAHRIGTNIEEFISGGSLPPEGTVIAMDKFGQKQTDYKRILAKNNGDNTSGGGNSGSGSSGGGGGSGSGGDGSGTGSGGVEAGGGGEEGGGSGESPTTVATKEPVYDANLATALALLENSQTGKAYYDLIKEKSISVIFDDFSKYSDVTSTTVAFWRGVADNTIYVNQNLRTTSPDAAIAALICHEATHADYDHYPAQWTNSTLQAHPELTVESLHITQSPYDSIDQEYNCYVNQVLVWRELKGTHTDANNDAWASIYDQGEAYMKSRIRIAYASQNLPEY